MAIAFETWVAQWSQFLQFKQPNRETKVLGRLSEAFNLSIRILSRVWSAMTLLRSMDRGLVEVEPKLDEPN